MINSATTARDVLVRTALVFVALFLWATCSSVTDQPLDDTPAAGSEDDPVDPPDAVVACETIDLLFVVDDSTSMLEELDNLRARLPGFIETLGEYRNVEGQPIDYRLAITTSGVSTQRHPSATAENGAFITGCGIDRAWLEPSDENVAQVFACRVDMVLNGPALEMPLLAVEKAFAERVEDGTNSGFLRDDSLLAVVILSDADDCSRTNGWPLDLECADDVAQHVHYLDALKAEAGRWSVAAIAGPESCSSAFGAADEAVRLKELTDMAGDFGVFSSICEGDLTGPLEEVLDTFTFACDRFTPID